ncbi:MAG: hypothetical protein H0U72_13765 [Nitrosospira sp.]|nr:hypothetical protein [Nitrosospira sp.]
MADELWEEHTTALTNIMLGLQRELRAVTEERDNLLRERDILLEERKRLASEGNITTPLERLWIPDDDEPPK